MNFVLRGSLKFMNISAVGELNVSLFASPAGLEGGRYVHEHIEYVHEHFLYVHVLHVTPGLRSILT